MNALAQSTCRWHRRLGLAAMLGLGGCAGALDPGAAGGVSQTCVEAGQPLQSTWLSALRSGPSQADPFAGAAAAAPAASTVLVRPEQVAVLGPDVYIADGGAGMLLRTDRMGSSFTAVARLPLTRISGLAVDRLGDVVLALPGESSLLRLPRLGGGPQRLGEAAALGSPVDVATDATDRIYVADGLGARVSVLNRIGQVQTAIGERAERPSPFTSVTAIALGPEGLYVLDAPGRAVIVVAPGAPPRVLSLGSEARFPVALAVDRWGRIFVADRGRRSLTVLQAAAPELGDLAGVPPMQNVSDVFVDDTGFLYVADAAAGAVHVLAVPRPCP